MVLAFPVGIFPSFSIKNSKKFQPKKKNKSINESAFMKITQKPVVLSGHSNNDVARFRSK